MNAEALAEAGPVDKSNLYRAIDKLVEAGILRELTGDKRHQVWVAHELVDAVDAFNTRLGKRARAKAG